MGKSEQTRKKIQDAALKLFSAKSFKGTTTKEIAVEAGVAEGTIFRYFNTKKDILLSLAGPVIIESLTDLMRQLEGKDDETVLTAILKNRLHIISKNKDLLKVIFIESQFHPELRDMFVREVVLKVAGMLEQYVNNKVETGDYRKIDPRIAARAVAGMLGIFVAWRGFLQGDKFVRFDDNEIVDEIVKIFLYGVKKHQEEGIEACADGLPPEFLFL